MIYSSYLCLESLALIWNELCFAMKPTVRNIMKCAMKQGNSEAAWYFFNLLRELLTNCSFKKKKKPKNTKTKSKWTHSFGHFYTSLLSHGKISAFPWRACFPTLSKEDAFVPLDNINTELKGLLGKYTAFSQWLSVLFFKDSSVFQICAIHLLAYFTGPLPKEVSPGAPQFLQNCKLKMA